MLRKNGFGFWKEVEEEVSLGQGPREMMMVWRKWKPGFRAFGAGDGRGEGEGDC